MREPTSILTDQESDACIIAITMVLHDFNNIPVGIPLTAEQMDLIENMKMARVKFFFKKRQDLLNKTARDNESPR